MSASATYFLAGFDRTELRGRCIILILCIMLGGVFPGLVVLGGPMVDNAIWLTLMAMVATFWAELPMARLLLPALPLAAWLLLYLTWGTLAAPYSILEEAYRLAIKFYTLIMAMVVVTSTRDRLRMFATAVQWLLVVNLAVTLLLMNRPEFQQHPFFARLWVDSAESDRFAGFWGNANGAGGATLVVLVLSLWASRFSARIGQICGPILIYLTASRTATWILVTLSLVYLVFLARPRVRLRAAMLVLLLATGAFIAIKATGASPTTLIEDNPALARILDVTESTTSDGSGGSRLGVLKDWLHVVPQEPWFGYGLFTFFGGESALVDPRPGFPTIGPHNQYLAIYLDTGLLGLLTYLAILARQVRAIRRAALLTPERHALYGLCFFLIVFSFFSHNMLTDYLGWVAIPLFFLLPAALAPDRRSEFIRKG